MLDIILLSIPLGITLSFLVGPVFFVLIETSISKGSRAALILDIGVVLADIFYILIAYFSSKQLLEDLKETPSLFLIGGAVIFTYGLSSVFSKTKINYKQVEVKKSDYFGLILKGFILNAINIGVLIFWLGTMVVAGPRMDFHPGKITLYFGLVILTYVVIDLVKIFLAKEFKKKLTSQVLDNVKKYIGYILMFFGLLLSLKSIISDEELENYIRMIF
jgi:threonine/homoserine/homoserine lactone efflux protein